MIALKYAQAILNALFHTGGSAGTTPEEDKAWLADQGVSVPDGITAQQYFSAFVLDGYDKSGERTKELDRKKEIVKQTTWYYTINTSLQEFTYKKKDDESGDIKEHTVYFSGWRVGTHLEQQISYPTTSFLALFTKIPNSNGTDYVEPITFEDETTSYMRVNLHEGIITGNNCLNHATNNEEDGGSILTNKEIIMFPEISGVEWGDIVGFGIFTNEQPMTGTPILWGELINGPITTTTEHVPLFRINDFKIMLS